MWIGSRVERIPLQTGQRRLGMGEDEAGDRNTLSPHSLAPHLLQHLPQLLLVIPIQVRLLLPDRRIPPPPIAPIHLRSVGRFRIEMQRNIPKPHLASLNDLRIVKMVFFLISIAGRFTTSSL